MTLRRHDRMRPHAARLLLLTLLMAAPAAAQYYSPADYAPAETRYLFAGAMARDFHPRGSNTASDSLRISFTGWMPTIGYHQGSVDIAFGYQRYMLRGSAHTSLFLGTTVASEFGMGRGPGASVAVPVLLSADYTKAESSGAERDNFNIAAVGLGLGLRLRLPLGRAEATLFGGEVLAYAIEGFSTGTGFSATTLADLSIVVREAGVLDGIVAGYRFRYQTWSMSEPRFNSALLAHGPYLGVLF